MDTEHNIFLVLLYIGFLLVMIYTIGFLYVFYKTEFREDDNLYVKSVTEYKKKYRFISSIGLIIIVLSIILSLIF